MPNIVKVVRDFIDQLSDLKNHAPDEQVKIVDELIKAKREIIHNARNLGELQEDLQQFDLLTSMDNIGRTILNEAILQGVDIRVIELLIREGANVNLIDEYGVIPMRNALFYSTTRAPDKKEEVILLLLQKGADTNAQIATRKLLDLVIDFGYEKAAIQIIMKQIANNQVELDQGMLNAAAIKGMKHFTSYVKTHLSMEVDELVQRQIDRKKQEGITRPKVEEERARQMDISSTEEGKAQIERKRELGRAIGRELETKRPREAEQEIETKLETPETPASLTMLDPLDVVPRGDNQSEERKAETEEARLARVTKIRAENKAAFESLPETIRSVRKDFNYLFDNISNLEPELQAIRVREMLDWKRSIRENARRMGVVIEDLQPFDLLNIKDEKGQTILMSAVMAGVHPKTIELLLDQGANINLADNYGQTPISFALVNGDVDLALLLLKEHGADVNVKILLHMNLLEYVIHYIYYNNNDENLAIQILKKQIANNQVELDQGLLNAAAMKGMRHFTSYVKTHLGMEVDELVQRQIDRKKQEGITRPKVEEERARQMDISSTEEGKAQIERKRELGRAIGRELETKRPREAEPEIETKLETPETPANSANRTLLDLDPRDEAPRYNFDNLFDETPTHNENKAAVESNDENVFDSLGEDLIDNLSEEREAKIAAEDLQEFEELRDFFSGSSETNHAAVENNANSNEEIAIPDTTPEMEYMRSCVIHVIDTLQEFKLINEQIKAIKEMMDFARSIDVRFREAGSNFPNMQHFDVINSKGDDNETILNYAIASGLDARVIEELLNEGARTNLKGKDDRTPIEHALMRKDENLVLILLEHGADINENYFFTNLLNLAIDNKYEKLAIHIIKDQIKNNNLHLTQDQLDDASLQGMRYFTAFVERELNLRPSERNVTTLSTNPKNPKNPNEIPSDNSESFSSRISQVERQVEEIERLQSIDNIETKESVASREQPITFMRDGKQSAESKREPPVSHPKSPKLGQ